MTAAEISAQIAKASASLEASPLMTAAREGLGQVRVASGRVLSSPEVQRLVAEAARRGQEEARIEEARRLEEATLALDRARRSRLRRLFIGYAQRLQDEVAEAEESVREAGDFWSRRAWPTGSPPLASELSLAGYLQGAHRHPAIARQKRGGVREWFEDWRLLALTALRGGLSSSDVAAIALATPPPQEALTRPPAPGAARPAFNWLRERFTAIAHPNAPGGPRLDPSPVSGGEAAIAA